MNNPSCCPAPRAWAVFLLRVALGSLFLLFGLGGLLLLGFRTRCALVLTGLTLIGLTFGMAVLHNTDVVAKNLVYLLLDAAALALLDAGNPLSVDACPFLGRGSCSSSSAPKP